MARPVKLVGRFFLNFFIIFFNSLTLNAQANEDDLTLEQLFNLPLQALSQITVSTGSKIELRPQDSPSIVTAYNRTMLDQLGYNTLSDLANITPGYSSYPIYGENVFETRGQKAASYDNHKHLLLIDGIPVAHARANTAISSEELPLYFAEQVEFLRGPGSALYGSSAYFGVINIKAKSIKQDGAISEFKSSMGNQDSNKRFMANVYQRKEGQSLSFNMGYYHKDPSRDFVGQTDDEQYLNFDDKKDIFLRGQYQIHEGDLSGFEAGVMYIESRGGLGEFWSHSVFSHEVMDLTWETVVPYLRYKNQISDDIQFSSYLKNNRSNQFGVTFLGGESKFENFNGEDDTFLIYEVVVDSWEWQSEIQQNISDESSAIFGLNIESRNQDDETFFYKIKSSAGAEPIYDSSPIKPDRINTYSIYGQYQEEFDILNGLILTTGARLDTSDSDVATYEQLSPRFALVQRLNKQWNIKAQIGQALRAPGLQEAGLNQQIIQKYQNNGINLNPDAIEPEIITTSEIGLTYATDSLSAFITYFQNETENTIQKQSVSADEPQDLIYVNASGNIEAQGFEIEVQYKPTPHWQILSNYSAAESEDIDNNELADVPTAKFNVATSYITNDQSVTIILKHIDGFQNSKSSEYEDPSDFQVLDLNWVRQLTKTTKLELQIRNVLDEEYNIPKTTVSYQEDINELGDIPIASRNLLISLDVTF